MGDNMVASRYVHRMVDILDQTSRDHVPVSFVLFCRAKCFLDWKESPSMNDLFMLDPRLRDRNSYVVHVKELAAHQHSFFNERLGKNEPSSSGSLLVVLQNELGRSHYGINESLVADIIRSMGANVAMGRPFALSAPEFAPSQEPQSFPGYFVDSQPSNPVSPMRQQVLHNDFRQQQQLPLPQQQQQQPLAFGAIGGTPISSAFSAAAAPPSGGRRARGRLF